MSPGRVTPKGELIRLSQMLRHGLSYLAIAISISACTSVLTEDGSLRSQAPIALNYPLTYQSYAQSVEHWRLIARETAKRLSAIYSSQAPIAIIVRGDISHESEFEAAYNDILLTEMVQMGIRVADNAKDCIPASTGCLRIKTAVQLVEHDPRRFVRAPPGDYLERSIGPGVIGLASWGISQATGPVGGLLSGLASLAVGKVAEQEIGSGEAKHTPNTEILVTTTVKRRDVVEYAVQGVYYIPPSEARDYIHKRGRTIEVTNQ